MQHKFKLFHPIVRSSKANNGILSLSLVLKRGSYFISKQATFVAMLLEGLSNDEKMNEFENNEVGKVTKIGIIKQKKCF